MSKKEKVKLPTVVTEVNKVGGGESVDQKPDPAPVTKRTGVTSHSYNQTSGGMTTQSGRFKSGG